MNNKKEKYLKFKEAFEELKGTRLYIVEDIPIKKRIVERGGYDHLGPLPDKVYTVVDHYEKKVKPITVDIFTIEKILFKKDKVFFTKEDAEWAILNKEA